MRNGNIFPARKEKRGLIATLIMANLLMAVVGIVTIIPNLRGVPEKAETPVAQSSALPTATEQETTAGTKEENTPAVSSESQPPEETNASLSTEERPDMESFLWYTEDVRYNGVPADAETIDKLSPLSGGWKAFIIYDPDDAYDSSAYEFLNISLTGTADDLRLTLDWYLIFWSNEGESFDETDMEDTIFNGKWEDGGLWASGMGTIRLTQFYSLGDKQYAVGTMDTPNGIPALIALVRP
jgi:hypothetical protein